jgi:ribonuclease HI
MGIIYFDADTTPNPGWMSVAVVIIYDNWDIELHKRTRFAKGTNNQGEWLACIWAIELAIERNIKNLDLLGDSQVVVRRAMKDSDIPKTRHASPPHITQLVDIFRNQKSFFKKFEIQWVPRIENIAGIYLEYGENKVRDILRNKNNK